MFLCLQVGSENSYNFPSNLAKPARLTNPLPALRIAGVLVCAIIFIHTCIIFMYIHVSYLCIGICIKCIYIYIHNDNICFVNKVYEK